MKKNLESFLRQNHPNYQVMFVVESRDDTAVPLILQVIAENKLTKARMIVAGKASSCGQKVHNLCRAADLLEKEIDIYAFADSDAATGNMWLRWLTDSIGREGVGARTGYRWMVPDNNRIPTLLACTANNTLAAMMGRGGHHLIWGGSWAIHRSVFRATGIREVWENVVSDDLAASRALQLANLKILFSPHCICSTRVQHTWSSLFEFFRRQLLITRKYSPNYWTSSFLLTAAVQLAFWGGIIAAVYANATQNTLWTLAFAGSATGLYAGSVARAAVRQSLGRKIDSRWRAERAARNFDLFAGPVTGLFLLAAFLTSCVGNTISWRGIHYFLGRGGTVKLLGRSIGPVWPIRTEPHNATLAGESAKANDSSTNISISNQPHDEANQTDSIPKSRQRAA